VAGAEPGAAGARIDADQRDQVGRAVAEEIARVTKVVESAGIKPE
jgi:hypothetical protein